VAEPVIRVGRGRHGRGVFATRDIAEGETVEVCPTLELPEDDVGGRLLDYVFDSGYDPHAVILPLGYGMLYNHSGAANTEYVEADDGDIAYVAKRDIAVGEELTINYGGEWWDTRGQTPG
jgi:uncharacterized protein